MRGRGGFFSLLSNYGNTLLRDKLHVEAFEVVALVYACHALFFIVEVVQFLAVALTTQGERLPLLGLCAFLSP